MTDKEVGYNTVLRFSHENDLPKSSVPQNRRSHSSSSLAFFKLMLGMISGQKSIVKITLWYTSLSIVDQHFFQCTSVRR